jgi:hypothetical protein
MEKVVIMIGENVHALTLYLKKLKNLNLNFDDVRKLGLPV